jgi:hypothetical protein
MCVEDVEAPDAYTHSAPQGYGNTADGDDECHFAQQKVPSRVPVSE